MKRTSRAQPSSRGVHKRGRSLIGLLVVIGLGVPACAPIESDASDGEEAAVLEEVEGTDLLQITLTARASERLGIETVDVPAGQVPYAAVLYDANGDTWVFTNPEPLVFVRQPITVQRIEGDTAFVTAGPPAGTAVVTIGAAELFGAELGTGAGH